MTDDDDPVVLTRARDEQDDHPDEHATELRTARRTTTVDRTPRRLDPRAGAVLLPASGSLDGLSREAAEAMVRDCVATGAVARFTSSHTAAVSFEPVDPGDRVFESSFNDRQRRLADGQQLSGPDAVRTVSDLFRAYGWSVRVSDSPRVLDASSPRPVEEWLAAWIAAAVADRPALEEWAQEYVRTRRAQLAAGTLRIVLHDREVLAWSP